jgi:hypothetical protein
LSRVQVLVVAFLVLLCLVPCGISSVFARRSVFDIYTPKQVMIQNWINLCDKHPDYASREVIGHSVEGRDIWLFAIGNPNGGRVMYDGQLHGWEDGGTEIEYKFAQWLLESGDLKAQELLRSNYNLFIPIINVDTTDRQNMRREYDLENGTVIRVPNGVDLNRNGVWRWSNSGSSDPADADNYHGLYAGSEPEIQAIRYALEKYHPQIYLNTHLGSSYMIYHSDTSFEKNIRNLITANWNSQGLTPYSMRRGLGGGLIASDADESFGASGWLIEIEYADMLPNTLDDFLAKYYPRVSAIFLAFDEAVAIPVDPSAFPSATPTLTPTLTPNRTPTPTAAIPTPTKTPGTTPILTPSGSPIASSSQMPTVSPDPTPSSSPTIDENLSLVFVAVVLLLVAAFFRKSRALKSGRIL